MQKLVEQLNGFSEASAGRPVEAEQIIRCQKELRQNDITAIPEDYLDFLHKFNGFAWNGSFLFGIAPFKDFFLDILRENLFICHPRSDEVIILGFNEYDYLAYNASLSCYQIIDKAEFMVLNTYTGCAHAVRHILKIEDDDQYI